MDYCCADYCGSVAGEGVSLKVCKACMLARYCSPTCQRNHWPKHKTECKLRAAELHDEALFKDPPAKEDCPICFLPMPVRLLSCMTLPNATITSVPIDDFAEANKELASMSMALYYSCCGKYICGGCMHSFRISGNNGTCAFCKADRVNKTDEERVEERMRRVEVNDAGAMFVLGHRYYQGEGGLHQDREKAKELYTRAAALGSSQAHYSLGFIYNKGGDLKKAKFHYEAAAMTGHEVARLNLGTIEAQPRNMGQAVKHWTIAASAGNYAAMHNLLIALEDCDVSRESVDSTLAAYNASCAEMRSEARDAAIHVYIASIGAR